MLEVGASIGRGAMYIINKMVAGLAYLKIDPNILTIIGVLINVACGVLFGYGHFFWAGITLLVANLFDMLDGGVARVSGNVTKFGAFLDSSLDRLSDMVIFLGVMMFYAANRPEHSLLNVFLAGVGMIGSVMVSYTAAKAEGSIGNIRVGFLQRPERIVLLIIGALSSTSLLGPYLSYRMPAVLWVLAIGSLWTFVNRVHYTWLEMQKFDNPNRS
ncbi:MAG TPA: CDP-alcohol phosphatidyltransferase family protein [Pyrinomonadaceae bacterium]|nr:CDP-alcohol phosphatidyltransferase family protein [Pyrinomonadaceae bacterium]